MAAAVRRKETWKTAGILILRHQFAVLQRRQPRRPKLHWADRALLGTLLSVIPKTRRRGLRLLVTPDTILRWHRDIVRRLQVPKIPSPYAACEYSWSRPPSRSRRRMRMLSPAGETWDLPSGGLATGPVWPPGGVVIDVFAEGVVEIPPAGDEDPVGALAPGAGDPPFADRVRARRLDGRGDDPCAGRSEDGVECAGVLGIAVSDQELQAAGLFAEVHELFRACWTVQAAVGWAVMPARWTRGRWCSTTNST